MPWDEIWKGIMSVGGVHPAFFLLACGVVLYLIRQLNKSEDERRKENRENSDDRAASYEKRIEEQRTTLQTLDRNAVNMAARTAAIDSTIAAINELTQGFAKIVHSLETHREQAREHSTRLDRQIEELMKQLRDLR